MAAPSSSLLLKNGTVIVHDTNDHAAGIKTDLLVRGNKIVEIAPNISAEDGVEVIDCQDKIIAPGFLDTHRHMYNTPLKGRYADSMLIAEYLVTGERARVVSIDRARACVSFWWKTDHVWPGTPGIQVYFKARILKHAMYFGVSWQHQWSASISARRPWWITRM